MLGFRKRTIAIFLVGFILGILAGSRIQTKIDMTVWPPSRIGDGSSAGGNVVFTATGGGPGQQKIDTPTFHAAGTFTVNWSTSALDASTSGGLSTIVLAGQSHDMIASFASKGSVLERHQDCSVGCYFTVSITNAKFTIQVLQ